MSRLRIFGLTIIALGIATAVYFAHRQKSHASPGTAESGIVASDPTLFGTTGRPQLVEFFHHA